MLSHKSCRFEKDTKEEFTNVTNLAPSLSRRKPRRNHGSPEACTKPKVAPPISGGKVLLGKTHADLSIMQSCEWVNESREEEREAGAIKDPRR